MNGQCFIFKSNASACNSILVEDKTVDLSPKLSNAVRVYQHPAGAANAGLRWR